MTPVSLGGVGCGGWSRRGWRQWPSGRRCWWAAARARLRAAMGEPVHRCPDDGDDRCRSRDLVEPGGPVAAGEGRMEAGEQEDGVTGEVDRPPDLAWQPPHGQRRRFDGDEQPHGDDAQCHGEGLPGRRERNREVDQVELHVAVGHERDQMDHDERHGEPAQPPMQIQQPGRTAGLGERLRRQHDAPDHRGRQHQPRHDARGAGEEPPELRIHRRDPSGTNASVSRSRSEVASTSPVVVTATPESSLASR